MIKVVDFDSGCGGFTSGLEYTGLYETVVNYKLNKNNSKCYNLVHKNRFSSVDFSENFDLLTYTFDLGTSLSKKGIGNFNSADIDNFLAFVDFKKPNCIIGITIDDAIPLLNTEDDVQFFYNNTPTIDKIACNLISRKYNVQQYVFDGAGFGLPQHVFYNLYFAVKNKNPLFNLKERFGKYKVPYKVPLDYLSSISDDSALTWHEVDYEKRDVCKYIEPGSNAGKTKEVSQKRGYKRINGNLILENRIDSKYYLVSSDSFSIHPIYDRPLTIREGALLYGLHNGYDWDDFVSKKDVAQMVCSSFYPKLASLIGKKITGYFL